MSLFNFKKLQETTEQYHQCVEVMDTTLGFRRRHVSDQVSGKARVKELP